MKHPIPFIEQTGTHVLMITNHGVHQWQVIPGLPDTGGQSIYVNQLTEALVGQGYRVTIVNRGGYPHPVTGEPQVGVVEHPSGRARIMYLDDGRAEFVHKEDMDEQIPALAADLATRLAADGSQFDLIMSHYWDAGKLGAIVNERSHRRVPHIWTPHSLGSLKKRNMDPSTWEELRIDERIAHERALLTEIDGAVATSTAIREAFADDYGYRSRYFLPPCIDTDRYHPRPADACTGIWDFLAERSHFSAAELRHRLLVTEISRTDRTKRKDVLIRAFAEARKEIPESLLVVALDARAGEPYAAAMDLIEEVGLEQDVIVLGSVWDELPCLYAVTSVYCTPSVMEGFGMSAQEAAATGKPVVTSDLVPFAVEYLLGDEPEWVGLDGHRFQMGEGAIIVPADSVDGFSRALITLLGDEDIRTAMGDKALTITVPYFTWEQRTRDLLDDLAIRPGP